MMMGMGRKRGIFGGGFDSMDMPDTLPSMSQIPTTAGGAFGNQMAQQPARKKAKFFSAEGAGPLVFSALADLGERLNGGRGDNLSNLMGFQLQQRQGAEQQAAAQREEAQRMAALQRLGYTPDQITALGSKLGEVQAARMKPDEAPTPGSFAWYQTATPEQRAQYGQYRDVGDDNEFVVVPIPGRGTYAGPRSGLPAAFGQGGQSGGARPVTQSDWDSASPMGGSGGNVGGGFR